MSSPGSPVPEDGGDGSGPPRLSAALLRLLLPERDREVILGDLEEEWNARRRASGRRAADRWYRLEALRSVLPASRRRLGALRRTSPEARRISDGIAPGRERPGVAGWLADLRFGFRGLRRNPGYALTVLLTVAVGIGVATAVFSLVDGVLLRGLPYPDADRLHLLWQRRASGGPTWVSGPDFVDWRDNLEGFAGMAALTPAGFNVSGGDEPLRVEALEVSAGFFEVLGTPPAAGRGFRPGDAGADARALVILGHDLWRTRYGEDPDVVGRSITLEGVSHAVVGVAAPDLRLPVEADLFVPLPLFAESWHRRRGIDWLMVVGRTRADVPPERVREEADRVAAALAERYPETNAGEGIELQPLRDALLGPVRTPLRVLLAAVLVVLLLVCANAAALILARTTDRREEVAVRRALGGSRARVVRQLLTESVTLALLGGAAGVAAAHGLVRILLRLAPPGIPRLDSVTVDGRVLAFALVATALTGLLSGVAPALRVTREDVRSRLGGRARWIGPLRIRLRSALVAAQLALALVLLTGSGLLLASFRNLRAVDPGFEPGSVLTARLPLTEGAFERGPALVSFYTDLLARLEGRPGVSRAGLVDDLPLGDPGIRFSYELREPPADPDEELVATFHTVTPGYFDAMGIDVVRGRNLDDGEALRDAPVVVVDERFARTHFPDRDPVGREVRILGAWRRIVGVVESVRESGLAGEPARAIYVGFGQRPRANMAIVLATGGEPAALAGVLRRELRASAPGQPLVAVRPMAAYVSDAVSEPRFVAFMVTVFASAALLLAALGVYGLLGYVVRRRGREIGVRMALGARHSAVRRLVVRRAAALTATGVSAGLVVSVTTTRYLRSLLYDVEPLEPSILLGMCALLSMVALVGAYLPARRATRISPSVALRVE